MLYCHILLTDAVRIFKMASPKWYQLSVRQLQDIYFVCCSYRIIGPKCTSLANYIYCYTSNQDLLKSFHARALEWKIKCCIDIYIYSYWHNGRSSLGPENYFKGSSMVKWLILESSIKLWNTLECCIKLRNNLIFLKRKFLNILSK